ncbi:MAG: hypothetical protein EXS59_02000 [Candidatus Taylorbacteria bacterium]|nr:hypothetical protein [Candidatus Taylorbacteria bacterium]
MIEIIPAIIPKTFDELEDKMSGASKLVPMVQIDVLDGSLVPIHAWPYQSANKMDMVFNDIVNEKYGFPFWEELEFEAHFMVRDPERLIEDWIRAGVSRIILEAEGVSDFKKCISLIDGRVPVGVSIALGTPREFLKEIIDDISVIQCMGWTFSHMGRQGEPLDENIFKTISEIKKEYPGREVAVDGGVTLLNAKKLIDSGADRLVVGSALWSEGVFRENLDKFKSLSL